MPWTCAGLTPRLEVDVRFVTSANRNAKLLDGADPMRSCSLWHSLNGCHAIIDKAMDESSDWRIFISYSHVDRCVVTPLTELIRVTGASTFRDEDSIPKGKRWKIVIAESLAACKTVLVFWSAAAADSKAVEKEYMDAIEKNKDVVPVLLDDTELPNLLREYQWIDLRGVVKGALKRGVVAAGSMPLGMIGGVVGSAASVVALHALLVKIVADRGIAPVFSQDEKMAIAGLICARVLPGGSPVTVAEL